MKKIIFLVFLFLLSFSSAIKISPTQQRLKMNTGESVCTNVWVLPHEDFIINSKWATEGFGDLNNYIYTLKQVGIKMNYSYISNGKYKLCFTSSKRGNISGIILFYSEKNMVEIGTWIELDVESESVLKKINLITGNVVSQEDFQLNLGLSLVLMLLCCVFVIIGWNFVCSAKNKNPKIDYSA